MTADVSNAAADEGADNPGDVAPRAAPAGEMGVTAVRGGAINSAVAVAAQALSYLQKFVLAWFLMPVDFTLFALAMTCVSFVGVFRDCGAGRILVQRGREFDRLAPSVFWLTCLFSVGCGVVIVALAPVVAAAYGRPELLPLLLVMAAQFPVTAAGTVSTAKLTIDMRWGALGVTTLVSLVITTAGSILMAWRGWGVYAFVVPPIAAEVVRGAAVWWVAGVRVRPRFEPTVIREVLKGSFYIIGSGLLLTARTQGDYVTLGVMERRMPGAAGTGFYYQAYTAAGGPRMVLVNFVGVLFPIFAKLEGERERAQEIYYRTLHAVAAIGVLVSALAACLAWPAFRLVLPATWGPSATLFAILIPAHLFMLLNGVVVQPMHAGGHFRGIFIFDLIFAPFEVACFAVGAYLGGTVGVAWAATIGAAAGFLSWHAYSYRVLRLSWSRAVGPLWKTLAAAAPAVALAWTMQRTGSQGRAWDATAIVAVGGAGTLAYALILRVLWPALVRDVTGLLRRSAGAE